jgi:hypothetical protein
LVVFQYFSCSFASEALDVEGGWSMEESAHELRSAASAAVGRAGRARELAREIEWRCRRMLGRDDLCRVLHTPAVWASRAASESRSELHHRVGGSLAHAAHELLSTRMALEGEAAALEASARSYQRRAELVDDRAWGRSGGADPLGVEEVGVGEESP